MRKISDFYPRMEIFEISKGLVVMTYRKNDKLYLRVVGLTNPMQATIKTIESQLGLEKCSSEEEMINSLKKRRIPRKTFVSFMIQPRTGKIIGVINDRYHEEITFRIIGFVNPIGLEKKYRELLENNEEVPYWDHFGLGKEWSGTNVTRDNGTLSLLKNGKSKPFEFEDIF